MEKNENTLNKIREIMEWIFCILIAIIIAVVFKYYIGTPTEVNQTSMYPTLKSGDRLWLDRTVRITKKVPERGQIITFEAPSSTYEVEGVNNSNPVAKYEIEPNNIFNKFTYYFLEFGKISYVKRAIAFPGESVKIENGEVYINGELLEEKYLNEDIKTESEVLNDFIVPDEYIFAMGDNRSGSKDCREFGCVPLDKIEGIAKYRIWPLNKLGKIDE